MEAPQKDFLEAVAKALKNKDEKYLLEVMQVTSVWDMQATLNWNPELLPCICAQGFLNVLFHLLDVCELDITGKFQDRNAMQWACLHGYSNIVKILLPRSVLNPNIWQETSEFYSASLGGHIEIIRILTNHSPEYVLDVDMRTSLLYAACLSGNVDAAKFWITPNMEINKPVELVSALEDCQYLVPLAAACKGGHVAVAEFLLEHCGAEITEHLAKHFPEFVGFLVNSVFSPVYAEYDNQVKYILSNIGLHFLHPLWIQPHLSLLTTVDLAKNKMRQLDICIPWSMPNLISLNVSNNFLVRFQAPSNPDEILCQSLEEVDLSHNNLEEVCPELFFLSNLVQLNLSQNYIRRLRSCEPSANSPLGSPVGSGTNILQWRCSNLKTLNLSNNQLDLLPGEISGCSSLTYLDVSHNNLCSLTSPWACNLEYLDASHNKLERFPPNTEQFWSGSLQTLLLNNNCLDQVGESIVKLGMLEKLNVSNNHIHFLAPPHLWDCSLLNDLNLSHNKLGASQKRKIEIEFPSELLSKSLAILNLSSNELQHLPASVCFLKNVGTLDISNNLMKDLPKEMGHMTGCWDLRLEGLRIQKRNLVEAIRTGKTQNVIDLLRSQLRKVQPCYIMKMIVLGPQGKGKSTVVEALMGGDLDKVRFSDERVTTKSCTLKYTEKIKVEGRKDSDRPDIKLRIWELPGSAELMAMHPVMWTEHSLILLVWDVTAGTSRLDHWLCGIKARLARVSVIIVGTFLDRIKTGNTEILLQQFHQDINTLYSDIQENCGKYPKEDHFGIYPHLSMVKFVSLVTRNSFKQEASMLRDIVYYAALNFSKITGRVKEFFIGQPLPQSYINTDKLLVQKADELKKNNLPPFLYQKEFDDLLSSVQDTDLEVFEDLQEALETWNQFGSILHFDIWPEGLCNLYFLDPNWLADMIATVLMPSRGAAPYKQSLNNIKLALVQKGFTQNIYRPFLQLLKHFDIGTIITEDDQECLLLPCRLPREAPGLQFQRSQDGRQLLRFYALPHVPARLWSRLILGVLVSAERFSQARWFLGAQNQEQERHSLTSSIHGLHMRKIHMIYWQEGLSLTYQGGSVIIESAVYESTSDKKVLPGILISVFTTSPNVSSLSVVGFLSDELDSAIQTIFPHHHQDPESMNIFALCPVCFSKVRPTEGIVRGDTLHFDLKKCAGALLNSDFALCHTGSKVLLEDLIPEFLLTELPRRFLLKRSELELDVDRKLGGGAVGSVYKGKLRGEEDIAIKVFYSDEDQNNYADSGTSSMSSGGSVASSLTEPSPDKGTETYGNFVSSAERSKWISQDAIDSRNLKVCHAFSELRQEITVLSKLRHPCIVSLRGVCVRPSLLVALELAPLGSLRSVIKKQMSVLPDFNKYTDKDKIFSPVLDKDINFKIVYQISLGLQYLHKYNILYRDLKTDNILVCSLDVNDIVNIKISDYGISKFTTPQGLTGMVGTPGYMAPEIMEGQPYDEKVDIFSFAMVIYEMLTGHAPFESFSRLHQIHQVVNYQKKRPSLKDYNVVANFPYLEFLMQSMWEHQPTERPSARQIVHWMQDVGFVLQHSTIELSDDPTVRRFNTDSNPDCGLFCNVTCAWASKEAPQVKGRNMCWVWEYPSGSPQDRRVSIYNLASNQFHTRQKRCFGQPVICMCKVGSQMWVGVKGGTLEIYGNSGMDIPRGHKVTDLHADPFVILHDKCNPNKPFPEGEGFVYVGLADGTVRIYSHYRWNRGVFSSEWRLWKTLTLSATFPVGAMHLVPSQYELWVSCGHSIIIISTKSLLVEKKICVLTDLPVSVHCDADYIQSMVGNEESMWCSFKSSSLIAEFNHHARALSGAFCLEADIEVYLSEVQLQRTDKKDVCSSCSPSGSASRRSKPLQKPLNILNPVASSEEATPPPPPPRINITSCKKWMDSSFPNDSEAVPDKQVPPPTESPRRPVRPAPPPPPPANDAPTRLEDQDSRGHLSVHLTKEEEESYAELRLPPKSEIGTEIKMNKSSSSGAVDDAGEPEQGRKNIFENVRVSMKSLGIGKVTSPSKKKRPATISTPGSPSVFYENEKNPQNPPVVPSRGRLNTVTTLPQTQTQMTPPQEPSPKGLTPPRRQPPPPPRLISEPDGIHVQSLLVVNNTLWLGTSCGEILVINVNNILASSDGAACNTGVKHSVAEENTTPRPETQGLKSSLDVDKICNLKSVDLNSCTLGPGSKDLQVQSGGVYLLLQAQNLVIALRNISQEQKVKELTELAIWEGCSAERISKVRSYWQLLKKFKTQLEHADSVSI